MWTSAAAVASCTHADLGDDRHMSPTPDVAATIQSFLVRANKPVEDLAPTLLLYTDGIGLDSLETAELSAVLEDTFGRDPFSSGGPMPQTVHDIFDFYAAIPAEA
jgi:acyl carrier protein